jgi:ABC-type uncharacterized transport system permease subunit
VYEINKEEDDLSLLNLVIIFMFLSSVVLYILYITKTHEKSYLVAKKITKQINLEIKTKGRDHIFYCFNACGIKISSCSIIFKKFSNILIR